MSKIEQQSSHMSRCCPGVSFLPLSSGLRWSYHWSSLKRTLSSRLMAENELADSCSSPRLHCLCWLLPTELELLSWLYLVVSPTNEQGLLLELLVEVHPRCAAAWSEEWLVPASSLAVAHEKQDEFWNLMVVPACRRRCQFSARPDMVHKTLDSISGSSSSPPSFVYRAATEDIPIQLFGSFFQAGGDQLVVSFVDELHQGSLLKV